MSIAYTNKINERSIGQSITSESHIIGILGTATYAPGLIRLIEVPQAPSPLSTVSIPGYNEIPSGTPTGMQFLVDYDTGVITFDTAQDGNTVLVSYIGLGSEIAAEDVNELQNPLGTVATQTIVYNWPSAPTVSWSLANSIVTPASITSLSTADFTFPRDVVVTRNLITLELTSASANTASTGVIRLSKTDSIDWRNNANSADLALGINGSDQLTFNGTPIEISTLTSSHIFVGNGSNVATDTAMTGDVHIDNTGATTIQPAVVTGSKIASATITNANINASAAIDYSKLNLTGDILATDIASGQVVKSLNSLFDNITLAAGSNITITPAGQTLTIAASSTSTGFQLLASDPGSPSTGDCWFNTTDFQFKGYNGTSVVILG